MHMMHTMCMTTTPTTTPAEAARAAGVSSWTIRRWITEGRLTRVRRTQTGRWWVDMDEVLDLVSIGPRTR